MGCTSSTEAKNEKHHTKPVAAKAPKTAEAKDQKASKEVKPEAAKKTEAKEASGKMILYGNPVSQPSRTLQWYIEYANKAGDIDVKMVDIFAGEHKKPEFVEKFPAGQVPSFEDGDFYLAESFAIMKYIAEGDALMPTEKKALSRLHEYMGAHNSRARKVTLDVIVPMVLKNDMALAMANLEAMSAYLETTDALLGKQDYIIGSSLSLADFLFAPEIDQLQLLPGALDKYSNITAYINRLGDVAGYKNSWEGAAKVFEAAKKAADEKKEKEEKKEEEVVEKKEEEAVEKKEEEAAEEKKEEVVEEKKEEVTAAEEKEVAKDQIAA